MKDAMPAAASRWPMLDFSAPNAQVADDASRPPPSAWLSAVTSMGSPSAVPVPCVSTYPMLAGTTWATAIASAITSACPLTLGAV